MRNLSSLVCGATLGERTSMEEIVAQFVSTGKSYHIVCVCKYIDIRRSCSSEVCIIRYYINKFALHSIVTAGNYIDLQFIISCIFRVLLQVYMKLYELPDMYIQDCNTLL